ncbi:hypothetical protein CJ030_MR5G010193 [Morella rubra]|uniref:Uncharacterized protein n=1 Tax=Morella rubra TaxID=262757 RepID=A0A6A1VJL0_9ROSI|nr:hypothetical protein CJ030_MR5G010193 [Morella rubra]
MSPAGPQHPLLPYKSTISPSFSPQSSEVKESAFAYCSIFDLNLVRVLDLQYYSRMAACKGFILAFVFALSTLSCIDVSIAARHLLQMTAPAAPTLPAIPAMPKPVLQTPLPFLPQPSLPTLPAGQPALPKPTLPPLPSVPTMPTIPKVTLPPNSYHSLHPHSPSRHYSYYPIPFPTPCGHQ